MSLNVTVHDETSTGSILNLLKITLHQNQLSAKELIRIRVYQEVQNYNTKRTRCYRGLVQPEGSEPVINGYRMKRRYKLNPERIFKNALRSFEQKGFSILVNEHPVNDPNQEIEIGTETRLSFLCANN